MSGVKGMRWGHHKVPTSEDHTRVDQTKQKAKAGGTKALSNRELQDAINRLNLEQQFKRLNPSKTEKAVRFVADILLGVGKQQIIRVANDVAAKQVGNLIKKD